MVTAQLSLLSEGMAMNVCAVSFVVNCLSQLSSISFNLKTQHGGEWTDHEYTTSFTRVGYNVLVINIPVEKATYAELEVTDITTIDVIYYSTLAAISQVKA